MSEYVTVVSVDIHQPRCLANGSATAVNSHTSEAEKKSSFVTVLSINNAQNTTTISTAERKSEGEIVTVYRLPGERLGFGLKFQGGTKTNEKVERLFIQSCDPNTPASRAKTPWGGSLSEGDEILEIDHEPVRNMTRIECVKCLKDKNVAINLLVKKGDRDSMNIIRSDSNPAKRPLPPPPPKIPPRKIHKKPAAPSAPVAPKIEEAPVAAELYLNCTLDDEQNRNDESDETGSTISSQISVISNFSSESDLSLLSASHASSSNSDLTRILTKPFQMIEREFNVNSTNVVSSTATPMSIDNLLLFTDSEPIEFSSGSFGEKDDMKTSSVLPAKTASAAEEAAVAENQRSYENVDAKKMPPVPRPRVSISMPQEAGEVKSSPTNTTIESWLNEANAVNKTSGEDVDKSNVMSTDAQSYEAIRFDCFAADDDMEEKLGPPELLNISEAYFNFSWCGSNGNNGLPTIGEAEEEFSSMEHFAAQKVNKGPIFIVHDTDTKSNEESMCHEREQKNMEINNNQENSSYLHEREDKSDKLIPHCDDKVHIESDKGSSAARMDARGGSEKSSCISLEIHSVDVTSAIETDKDSKSDSDECLAIDPQMEANESEKIPSNHYESAKITINNEMMIKIDSEGLDAKEISTKVQNNTAIASHIDISESTQTSRNYEIETDHKDTATEAEATSSSFVRQSIAKTEVKMEKKQLPIELNNKTDTITVDTTTKTESYEIAMKRTSSLNHLQSYRTSDNATDTVNKFSTATTTTTTTTKATAIVAPQRKTHHFEEITNLVDTKPPFKSATLGRQRVQFNYRNKDEKSEKSVRDKIAMFSNSTSDISHILPKTTTTTTATTTPRDKSLRNVSIAKSTENIFSSVLGGDSAKHKADARDFFLKKKAMSVENLDDYDDVKDLHDKSSTPIRMTYTPISKPASLHTPTLPRLNIINRAQSVEQLDSIPALPTSRPPSSAPISRLSRHISFNGYASDNGSPATRRSDDGTRIVNILENRKKNLSKLRGLVIPEKVPENEMNVDQKVLGLPVIRSKECELIDTIKSASTSPSLPVRKAFVDKKMDFEVRPAPRKSIDEDKSKITPPIKPPRTSLIFPSPKSPVCSTLTAATDESDTESCQSSRVSTPPVSPIAKKPLIRTLSSNSSLSSNSTLTSGSGSQASCSSNVSGSPETEVRKSSSDTTTTTRKSIVASSKSRSGRECLDKSWRDEDSTDGGIDNDNEKQRVPKAKARSSLTNYKVVNHGDNLVDKVINVATYVEVISSDSEEKIESSESVSKVTTQKTVTVTKTDTAPALTDMAKWVRKEVSKTTEIVKKTVEKKEEIRKIPKTLESPKKLNFSEIRKNFENKQTVGTSNGTVTSPPLRTPTKEKMPQSAPATTFNHNRFSSWDSVASSSSGVSSELLGTGTGTNNPESLQTIQSDFGSFSSFGSSHSLITPQDLQSIIDEADPPLETSEAFVVVLHRETPESSIGITLAGGSDYEAKEITIHRILTNSPADKDGRLKKGDRLLSINGLSMRGLTHRESLSVLKSPRTDVVMVVTRSKSVVKTNSLTKTKLGSLGSLSSLHERADVLESDIKKTLHSSRSVDNDLDAISNKDCSYRTKDSANFAKNIDKSYESDLVTIIKDGTGIGISLEGGFDSPTGNRPLVIKKIFMGGAAEKLSNLKAGDEILEINGSSTEKQTRIDVWNMIKKLPQGEAVQLKIKRC